MNIDLIVLSTILITLVFLPFILVPLVQKRGSVNLQKKFKEEEQRFNLSIDIKENWNCNYLGIDSVQKKFLFVQRNDEDFYVEIIDLNLVSSCRVVVSEVQKKINGKLENVLEGIDLEFSFYGQEKKLIKLYDSDINPTQDLEVMHAQKWNNHIAAILSSRPAFKKTA